MVPLDIRGRGRPFHRVSQRSGRSAPEWHGQNHPLCPLGGGKAIPIGKEGGGKLTFTRAARDNARGGRAWRHGRVMLVLLATNGVSIRNEKGAQCKKQPTKNSALRELHHEVRAFVVFVKIQPFCAQAKRPTEFSQSYPSIVILAPTDCISCLISKGGN